MLTDLAGDVHDSSTSPTCPATSRRSTCSTASPIRLRSLGAAHPEAPARLVGVGIGMVGPLDYRLGVVRDAHGLRHWHDVPLRDLAAARLGVPVIVDKDTTAGVIAEAWRRGPDFRDAALIMVETGVGVGLWLGGAPYRGAHTNAGEFGHTVDRSSTGRCACADATAAWRSCTTWRSPTGTSTLAARVLASGVVNLLQTIDRNHVVLAGSGIARHRRPTWEPCEHAVRTEVLRSDWLPSRSPRPRSASDFAAAGAAMEVLTRTTACRRR